MRSSGFSPAIGEPQRLRFDVDLALDGGDVYAAQAIAADSSFSCDVVSLEPMPRPVCESILRDGRLRFRRG